MKKFLKVIFLILITVSSVSFIFGMEQDSKAIVYVDPNCDLRDFVQDSKTKVYHYQVTGIKSLAKNLQFLKSAKIIDDNFKLKENYRLFFYIKNIDLKHVGNVLLYILARLESENGDRFNLVRILN